MTGGLADTLLGARRPDDTAVRHGARALSYRDLGDAALRVAAGIPPGSRVGLYLDRSLEAIVAIYAVLCAGATYVPLDVTSPPGRSAWTLGHAGVELVLSAREWSARRRALERAAPAVRFLDVEDAPGAPARPREVAPEHAAYILYTSGSTGSPRGVEISHRAALAFAEWAATTFGLSPGDRVSGVSPLQFDLSTLEIFGALAGGATASVAPRAVSAFPGALARFLEEEGVTVWYSVPSALSRLHGALARDQLPRLRCVLYAGEPFAPPRLAELMDVLPTARFANLFGPTETNVCTWFPLSSAPSGPVPIGGAACGSRLRVVGHDGGDAEEGELWVSGPAVMTGYLGDPEATGASFSEHDGVRWYRTRDRVRRQDGVLLHLGRMDTLLKARGFRVQPEEVEAALHRMPGVREALVDLAADGRLRAHVVSRGGDPVPVSEIRAFVATQLPSYLVPEVIELVDALARTERGKLVRGAPRHARDGQEP